MQVALKFYGGVTSGPGRPGACHLKFNFKYQTSPIMRAKVVKIGFLYFVQVGDSLDYIHSTWDQDEAQRVADKYNREHQNA